MVRQVQGHTLVLPLLLAGILAACGGGSTTSAPAPLNGSEPLADGSAIFIAEALEFSADEDTPLVNQLSAIPGVQVTFGIIRSPRSGLLDLQRDGQFTYTPNPDFFGDDSFEYYAWTAGTIGNPVGSAPATVKIRVAPVADAPVISGEPVIVIEQGSRYEVQFIATDVDGDSLQFSAENLPDWLTLDPDEGLLSGIPQQPDVGLHEQMSIRVTDSGGLQSAYPFFLIEVLDVNDSPTINPTQFPDRLDAREMISVNVFPDDPDGDRVTLSTEQNDFVNVEIRGGQLSVTAKDVGEVTPINLVVIAIDHLGSVTRQIIPITLYPLTNSGKGRTLLGSKSGAGVHMVVLGEGYKLDEQDSFEQHVRDLIGLMSGDSAVQPHLSAWNVHSVLTPSQDSGIDDNPLEDVRHTEFDASYYCRQLPRLICADELHLFEVALDEYPYLDQLVLLVNDLRYGGSGGSVAVASAYSPEIALHEMGHSIAGLADEYVDSLIPPAPDTQFVEGRYRNVSALNNPESVPWTRWIADGNNYPTVEGQYGVGVFEGAYYQAARMYRPTSNSRMRDNTAPFGPVNGEQWALSVYRMTNAILDFGPITRRLSVRLGQQTDFYVAPLFDDNLQRIEWFLDGQELEDQGFEGRDWPRSISLQPTTGEHMLELRVTDISGLIRQTPPHPGSFVWRWKISVQ